ncbi:hypothetical protein BD310DRAFT_871139 [Dichomitus squalens]|uniref:polynucleotide adenylyltransferase n=1 Tax=Dichomitus squalens TaxID=114155 RepID=A0A4Q9Q5W7_9APHY|nr:hypothetical protein BD310DRAFT_871139 [Dichomitus squalens]
MDPSTLVAAGPSNIPPPVIKAEPSTQKLPEQKRKRSKRKRNASEAATSVAGDPPATATNAVVGAQGEAEGEGGLVECEAENEEVWSTPWIDGLGTTSYESKEQRLHDEIVAFFQYISPTPEEAHARAMVIAKVSSLVTRRFPQGAVDTFGSVAQNLYLPDGDTDMVVTMPPQYDDPETKKRTLFQLAALMRNNRVTPHVQVIHRARVPVISFQTVPDLGSLKIDVSLNATDGLKAVPILRSYFDRMPALRHLVLCLKALLSRHGLNSASFGGLSSYALICLAISFLQLNPMGRPKELIDAPVENESLGVLLMDFLEYYGHKYKYETGVVSPTQGRVLTKEEKGWTNPNHPHALCIECLLHPDNDVGRPTSKVGRIRTLFQESHAALQAYVFSDAPAAYNVLGIVLGVSEATLGHRGLLKDIVASGRLDRALNEVELTASQPPPYRRPPGQGQYQPYPRHNARPYGGGGDRDWPRYNHLPPRPPPQVSGPAPLPPHHSLPPRPDSGHGQKSRYVAQGPSFGAMRAAATPSTNGNGNDKESRNGTGNGSGGGNGKGQDANPKPNSGSKPNIQTDTKSNSSPGSRSPPRRRRKAH